MRFSLRDLLLFVAFAAGIAWCAAQVGFDSGMFWFVVGFSAVLSAVFVYFARDERRRRRALVFLIPVLALSFLALSIALFVNSALLSIATVILAGRARPSVRTLWAISAAVTLTSLLAAVLPVMAYMRELESARREITTVSLVQRLEYERREPRLTRAQDSVTKASLVSKLDQFEQSLDHARTRKWQLHRLHAYQYRLFESAMGFGLGRIIPLTPRSLRVPPLRDIRFDDATVTDYGDERGVWYDFGVSDESTGAERVHLVSRNDFLNPDGFGLAIEPPLNVMGFVEHGFHYSPTASLEERERWTIVRLELVSLLKFDTPRVYVLDHLPRMDQLSSDNAPTRPLDAFESEALAKLRHDEDVVVKSAGDDYRMLGSLRAAKQCLDCHSVQRGELLGAFSYSLRHEAASKR